MAHQNRGYHQQFEMVRAHQAELRGLGAEQRQARQLSPGTQGLPTLARLLLARACTRVSRWVAARPGAPRGGAPAVVSNRREEVIGAAMEDGILVSAPALEGMQTPLVALDGAA